MYTTWLSTLGEPWIAPPVVAVQSGVQTFGEPLQLVVPAASKARTEPFVDPTITAPSATAGDDAGSPPRALATSMTPVHSGLHVSGLPLHREMPAASKASSLPSSDVT